MFVYCLVHQQSNRYIEMEPIEYIIGRYPYALSAIKELVPLFASLKQGVPSIVHIDTSAYDEYLVREMEGMTMEPYLKMGLEREVEALRRAYGTQGGIVAIKVVVTVGKTILTAHTFGTAPTAEFGSVSRRSMWVPSNLSGKKAICYLCVCYSQNRSEKTVFAPILRKRIVLRRTGRHTLKEIIGKCFCIPKINPYSTYLIELARYPIQTRYFLERGIAESLRGCFKDPAIFSDASECDREGFVWM
jgi:hypothetical protein